MPPAPPIHEPDEDTTMSLDRPESISLERFLPPGPPRRLADGELSEVVRDVASAMVPRGGKMDHEDAVQDLALEVLERRGTDPSFLEDSGKITKWVERGLDARDLKVRRRIKRLTKHAPDISALLHPDRGMDTQARVDGSALLAVLRIAIAALPLAIRQVFHLIRLEGYTRVEAAEKLGRSESTVKNQMTEALKRLRAAVNGYFDSINGPKEPRP